MRLSRYFIAPEVNLMFFPKLLPIHCPELLRAQGITPGTDVGRQGSPVNDKKRAREGGSPGPSRNHPKVKIKRGLSGDARAQRMRVLQVSQGVVCFVCFFRIVPDGVCMQVELDALKTAEQSGTSIKREMRSPSPIVVRHSGEVVDLTLDG